MYTCIMYTSIQQPQILKNSQNFGLVYISADHHLTGDTLRGAAGQLSVVCQLQSGVSPTLCRGKAVMDLQTLLVCFRGENTLLGIHNMCCHQLGVSMSHLYTGEGLGSIIDQATGEVSAICSATVTSSRETTWCSPGVWTSPWPAWPRKRPKRLNTCKHTDLKRQLCATTG